MSTFSNTEKLLIAPVIPQNSKILQTLLREILLSALMYDLRLPAPSPRPAGWTVCQLTGLRAGVNAKMIKGIIWIIKCGSLRYFSTVCVLPAVHGGRRAPSLENEQELWCRKLNNVLLWTGSAATCILATKKKIINSKSVCFVKNIWIALVCCRMYFWSWNWAKYYSFLLNHTHLK